MIREDTEHLAVSGLLFQPQRSEALIEVIKSYNPSPSDQQVCRNNALRFSERAFDDSIMAVVESMLCNRP